MSNLNWFLTSPITHPVSTGFSHILSLLVIHKSHVLFSLVFHMSYLHWFFTHAISNSFSHVQSLLVFHMSHVFWFFTPSLVNGFLLLKTFISEDMFPPYTMLTTIDCQLVLFHWKQDSVKHNIYII